MRSLAIVMMILVAAGSCGGEQKQAGEEQAIRTVLDRFYDGWNAHDVDAMVSIYAEDIDHINVFGEWHTGKESIRNDIAAIHSGSAHNSQRKYTIEKMRFVAPEVAVVQVLKSRCRL